MREIDDALPGADLIRDGLRDLENGVQSVESLLVLVGAPRLSVSFGLRWRQPPLFLAAAELPHRGSAAACESGGSRRRTPKLQ